MTRIKKKTDDRASKSFAIWMTVVGVVLIAGYAAVLGVSNRPHGHMKKAGIQKDVKTPMKADTLKKVMDPVCGMMVTPPAEGHIEHLGKSFYFCSRACKEAFEKEPGKYSDVKAQRTQ